MVPIMTPGPYKHHSTNLQRFSSITAGGGGAEGNWLTQAHLKKGC